MLYEYFYVYYIVFYHNIVQFCHLVKYIFYFCHFFNLPSLVKVFFLFYNPLLELTQWFTLNVNKYEVLL